MDPIFLGIEGLNFESDQTLTSTYRKLKENFNYALFEYYRQEKHKDLSM